MARIPLPRNKALKIYSTDLRNNATKEEKRLWYDFLCKYTVPFTRQRIIGNYIADFYCPQAKLVIELDGAQHFTEEALSYDAIRTDIFNAYGIEVIRFTNDEIRNYFDEVCMLIDKTVQQRRRNLSQLR